MTLALDDETYDKLDALAKANERSVHGQIVFMLKQALSVRPSTRTS